MSKYEYQNFYFVNDLNEINSICHLFPLISECIIQITSENNIYVCGQNPISHLNSYLVIP